MRAGMNSKKAIKPHLNGSWLQQQRPGHAPSPAHILAAAVALLTAISCCVYAVRTFHTHLLVQNVLDTPIVEPRSGLMLDVQQHAADEMLLRQLVDECVKQEQSVIHLDSQRRVVTSSSINPQHCPALDIALPASERVFGTCTDAALYMIHVGGRLISMPADVEGYDSYCGPQTARLFLDNIHPQLLSKRKHVLHMQLVKTSSLKPQDAPLHARMQAFLCKTRQCTTLMQQHVVEHGYWASVWYMGLASSDAKVGTSGDVISAVQASVSPGNPKGFALHVRSLKPKQTKAVLDCWAKHPELLPLVVVGRLAESELAAASRAAANIIYQPPLAAAAAESPGAKINSLQNGPRAAAAPLETSRLKSLQAAAALHVIPALNEGSLHAINEARAVGALVVTTGHPPMSELVSPEQGVLVPTVTEFLDNALGSSSSSSASGSMVGGLDAHVSADSLCTAVQQALALPPAEAAAKRAAAAAHYKADQAAFVKRAEQLRAHLQALSAEAAGTSAVSPAAEAAAASIVLQTGDAAAATAGVDSSRAQAALGRKVAPVHALRSRQ